MWRKYYIRHQMLVKAIVVDLVAVGILLGGILPLVSKIQSNMKKIEARAKEEKILSEKVVLLSQIDKAVLKERAQIIKDALPEKKDVIAYLGSIDGLSRELGLSFGGITLAPGDVSQVGAGTAKSKKNAKQVASLQVLDTDVKITGSKEGLYTFLKLVEQTLPLMQVANVKISAMGTDNYTLAVTLGMLWAPYSAGDVKGAVSLFTEKEEGYFQKLANYKRYDSAPGEDDFTIAPVGKNDLFAN